MQAARPLLTIASRFASIRTAASSAMSRGASLFGATPLETPQTLTPDGGVIKAVLARGTGPLPAQGDELVCQYTGKLEDGTVFDSSRGKGRPFVFRVGIGQVNCSSACGGLHRCVPLLSPPSLSFLSSLFRLFRAGTREWPQWRRASARC
jgi:hypothetical protein